MADALSHFLITVNIEWELHQAIFHEITIRWNRPLIDLFVTSVPQIGDLCFSNSRSQIFGCRYNDSVLERGVQLHRSPFIFFSGS